jgi:hypothetical protein
MNFDAMARLVAEHWMLMTLILCPILIVTMALAALTCEACGAPFGVFRRRNRTIDLCLRCALLHDYRRVSDRRAGGETGPAVSVVKAPGSPSASDDSRAEDRREGRKQSVRRVHTGPVPTVDLGVAGHRGRH